jgi:hypothetical protein
VDLDLARSSGRHDHDSERLRQCDHYDHEQRQVVAYSDVGARLWQLTLGDLAPTAPVRINDREAVLVDLAGEIRRFDLATGTVLWQGSAGSDVNVSPTAGAGLFVIMDRGGTTTAYEQTTGERRWEVDMQGASATVMGDTVVVIQDQTAHALLTTTGTHQWVRPIFGTLTDMATFAGQIVVATKSDSIVLSGGGAITKRLGPLLTMTASRDHLVGWGPTEASVNRKGRHSDLPLDPAGADTLTARPACPGYLRRRVAVQQRLDVSGPGQCSLRPTPLRSLG